MKKLTKTQQLAIIEGLCIVIDTCIQPKITVYKNTLEQIYKIAHLNRDSACMNKHLGWHKEGFELIKSFKKNGISSIKE